MKFIIVNDLINFFLKEDLGFKKVELVSKNFLLSIDTATKFSTSAVGVRTMSTNLNEF